MNAENLKLRNRFVDDFSLPVSVLDSPYFEYQLKLYESYNETDSKWKWLISLINEHSLDYFDDENVFLEDYYFCRDRIIENVEASPSYQKFIFSSTNFPKRMSKSENATSINSEFAKIPKTSIYTEANDGKVFLSIDLKHANFQTLKYYDPEIVNYAENYEDFIKSHIGHDHPLVKYFADSKYTRQIIFGKLNMARNVVIQNFIIYKIWNAIRNIMGDGIKIHSKQVDELIFEVENAEKSMQFLKDFFSIQKLYFDNIQVNHELYRLKHHSFETSSGNFISVFEKYLCNVFYDGNNVYPVHSFKNNRKIKSCPLVYFPQVYKILTEQEICEEMDLTFYYEKNLCKFLKPIKKV